MLEFAAAILAMFVTPDSSEVSMNDRVIPGTVFDQRISECGVTVTMDALIVIRPFIETSSALTGTARLVVIKQSSGGTSQTSQSWDLSGSELRGGQVAINGPADLAVRLDVIDENGSVLCTLDREFEIEDDAGQMPAIRG